MLSNTSLMQTIRKNAAVWHQWKSTCKNYVKANFGRNVCENTDRAQPGLFQQPRRKTEQALQGCHLWSPFVWSLHLSSCHPSLTDTDDKAERREQVPVLGLMAALFKGRPSLNRSTCGGLCPEPCDSSALSVISNKTPQKPASALMTSMTWSADQDVYFQLNVSGNGPFSL